MVYPGGRSLAQIPWMSSNNSQVLEIPCFGKSIDFQRQSFAGVGNSISWQFLFDFQRIGLNSCGKFLVSTNPLTFNEICFDKAFPTRIILFFYLSILVFFICRFIYLISSFFRLSPFGGIGGPERTVFCLCWRLKFSRRGSFWPVEYLSA